VVACRSVVAPGCVADLELAFTLAR
jgi:hypothetical protein